MLSKTEVVAYLGHSSLNPELSQFIVPKLFWPSSSTFQHHHQLSTSEDIASCLLGRLDTHQRASLCGQLEFVSGTSLIAARLTTQNTRSTTPHAHDGRIFFYKEAYAVVITRVDTQGQEERTTYLQAPTPREPRDGEERNRKRISIQSLRSLKPNPTRATDMSVVGRFSGEGEAGEGESPLTPTLLRPMRPSLKTNKYTHVYTHTHTDNRYGQNDAGYDSAHPRRLLRTRSYSLAFSLARGWKPALNS